MSQGRKKTGAKAAPAPAGKRPKPAKPQARPAAPARTVAAKSQARPAAPARTVAAKPQARPAAPARTVAAKPQARPAAPARTVAAKPAPAAKSNHQPAAVLTPSASAVYGENFTDEQLRKVKTGLSKRELDGFAALLVQKRREILGDVDAIQSDARSKNNGGDLSNMPLHMADVGTDNYEQEFNLGLVESERKLLREINEALLRIKRGIYGVCLESGKPIGRARLEAKPWAKYSIEVAREKERHGRR